MARPASNYRAGQRNLIRPMGGMKPDCPRGLKGAAQQMAKAVRQHVNAQPKKAES